MSDYDIFIKEVQKRQRLFEYAISGKDNPKVNALIEDLTRLKNEIFEIERKIDELLSEEGK